MQITNRCPVLSHQPTQKEWDKLVKPSSGQGDAVIPGLHADDPLPQSMAEVRQQVAALDYAHLDPYVASVAGSIGADQNELPKGETELKVKVPHYYADEVEVLFGNQNGPGAPLLLILPGIHSEGTGSHSTLLKKLALERGMNYVMLPNSMSAPMLDDVPVYHPGNPRVDALATRELLGQLKNQLPEYFQSISVAGYSYGALQGANLIRLDEESPDRLIDGGLVAVSPPENLEHSMHQLDGLRELYQDNNGSVSELGLEYKHDVRKYGYQRFPAESKLAQHGEGTNVTEIEISDKYGSRDSLKSLIERVDTQFGHNQLPMNTQAYKDANLIEKYRMRQEHKRIVENITYDQMSSGWMSQDAWLQQQGLTPTTMAERYSFSNAIDAIHDTPVMMLASADDYILEPRDVELYRHLQTGPLEVVRVLDNGGHVGVDWNPEAARTMIDFARAAPQLKNARS